MDFFLAQFYAADNLAQTFTASMLFFVAVFLFIICVHVEDVGVCIWLFCASAF